MESPFQRIHDILWDDDKAEEKQSLVREVLSSDLLKSNPSAVTEFETLIRDLIDDPATDQLFEEIISYLLVIRNEFSDDRLYEWQKITDALIQLSIFKSTYTEESSIEDLRLSYNLYASLLETYPQNYEDSYWSSFISGFATSTFNYGFAINDTQLIKSSFEIYERSISFYQTGSFPDHWALHNMIGEAELEYANRIMDAFEKDKGSFVSEIKQVESLIEGATEKFLDESNNKIYSSGSTIRVEQIDKAGKRLKTLMG